MLLSNFVDPNNPLRIIFDTTLSGRLTLKGDLTPPLKSPIAGRMEIEPDVLRLLTLLCRLKPSRDAHGPAQIAAFRLTDELAQSLDIGPIWLLTLLNMDMNGHVFRVGYALGDLTPQDGTLKGGMVPTGGLNYYNRRLIGPSAYPAAPKSFEWDLTLTRYSQDPTRGAAHYYSLYDYASHLAYRANWDFSTKCPAYGPDGSPSGRSSRNRAVDWLTDLKGDRIGYGGDTWQPKRRS